MRRFSASFDLCFIVLAATPAATSASRMSNPAATQGPLAFLVALALFCLYIVGLVAWYIYCGARNLDLAKKAIPVMVFSLAAICGVLLFANDFGIVQLIETRDDREAFVIFTILLFLGGLAWKAFGVGTRGPKKRRR
jgi:sugar phosphate permease